MFFIFLHLNKLSVHHEIHKMTLESLIKVWIPVLYSMEQNTLTLEGIESLKNSIQKIHKVILEFKPQIESYIRMNKLPHGAIKPNIIFISKTNLVFPADKW